MPVFKDLTGMIFGRLTIIKLGDKTPSGRNKWVCQCECGNIATAQTTHLMRGIRVSCGCKKDGALTHGMCRSRTYEIWSGMKKRCENKKSIGYSYYGENGIKVCDKWKSFEGFFDDMGAAPDGFSLDRVEGKGNYCKENCRWADAKTQTRNRSVTRFDEDDIFVIRTMLLYGDGPLKISKAFGVSKSAISHISKGRAWTDIEGCLPV